MAIAGVVMVLVVVGLVVRTSRYGLVLVLPSDNSSTEESSQLGSSQVVDREEVQQSNRSS